MVFLNYLQISLEHLCTAACSAVYRRRIRLSLVTLLVIALVEVCPAASQAEGLRSTLRRSRRQDTGNDTIVQIADIVRLLGPRNQVDFVAVLDRSQSVGKRLFYSMERGILEAVLTQYATTHPDYVRTSVVTFSKDATVVYDHISDWQSSLTKCELFDKSPSPVFSEVMFTTDPLLLSGTQLQGAFNLTLDIFRRGKQLRPNATQVMLLMTDGDYAPYEDPTVPQNILLKDLQVNVFSMGLGSWLKTGSVRAMSSKPYYYGTINQWRDLIGSIPSPVQYYVPSSVSSDVSPFWTIIPRDVCGNSAGSQNCSTSSSCYCDVDTRVRQCMCEAGHQPALDDVMATELSGMSVNESHHCQACPLNTYKEFASNEQCTACSVGLTTLDRGSTNISMCTCDNCTDPCTSSSCPAHSRCTTSAGSQSSNQSYTCKCHTGWTAAPICTINDDDCMTSQAADCLNNARCYDKPGYVQCICPLGFKGRYCEIREDECDFPGICLNNATCVNLVNDFMCVCPGGWIGNFCEDVDPSYKPSSPSTPPPTQVNFTTSSVIVLSSSSISSAISLLISVSTTDSVSFTNSSLIAGETRTNSDLKDTVNEDSFTHLDSERREPQTDVIYTPWKTLTHITIVHSRNVNLYFHGQP